MSSLLVFNKVYSGVYSFRPAFWTIAPLTFSLVSSSPPFPVWMEYCWIVNKYTVYTYTVCKGGGVWGHMRGGGLRQLRHLPQSPQGSPTQGQVLVPIERPVFWHTADTVNHLPLGCVASASVVIAILSCATGHFCGGTLQTTCHIHQMTK